MTAPSHCIKCNKELPPGALFCAYCGTKQDAPQTEAERTLIDVSVDASEAQTLVATPQDHPSTVDTLDVAPYPIPSSSEKKQPPPQLAKMLPPGGVLPAGTVIGRHYVLEEKIGEGGMGVVYRAFDRVMERSVAIKLLHANLLGEQGIRRRFLREGRLMSTLNHPNIVQVYDLLEEQRILALVMEFVEGITLTEHLKQWGGQLPYAEILNLLVPVLDAMEEAHNQGIIHRDLKPDNILLQHTATRMFPKIADFGLAKIIEGTSYTVSGALLGTCMYMSPEQIKNKLSLDQRADIYSLGITLYQLCAGRCPFQDTNHFALMMAHVQQEPVPPSRLRDDLPEALEALILEALVKEPDERLSSCLEFRERLEAAIPHTEPPPTPEPVQATLPPVLAQADGSEMVLIPSGDFLMGPKRRKIYLDAFYLDRHPVTNKQFRTFMEVTGYRPSDASSRRFLSHWSNGKIPRGQENHPVVFVSWHDARAYATWAGKALPTEAQWEKAARGLDGRKFPWGREAPDAKRANFGRSARGSLPVGSHELGVSPFGLHDMAGNVWEWCDDVDDPEFYRRGPTHNPRNVMRDGQTRYVLRGGSWMYDAQSLRTTTRKGYEPHYRLEDVGFRCVRYPTQVNASSRQADPGLQASTSEEATASSNNKTH
ncbi:MAG: hypothetical protein EP343_01465 [Deltaproteobacteria bacterium]|nr:MAG: hypothetical protein EP343_01465 [Deltaproteobacteria bacterium]